MKEGRRKERKERGTAVEKKEKIIGMTEVCPRVKKEARLLVSLIEYVIIVFVAFSLTIEKHKRGRTER